ncbi:MAG: hypothetical protein D6801_05075 [Alphaproteobacteria bacterium]|nr:MAG: hypothetical protein D6801_05075 [Alphaproteobacteria bacterium]
MNGVKISRRWIAQRLHAFRSESDGAVTVDWIVLTATIVLMGLAAAYYVGGAVPELATSLKNYMTGYDVGG